MGAEIIIQYGYVTLFVICFPAIPVLAFFNNVVEIKIDGYKLIHNTRRAIPTSATGLGTWVQILEFFSVVSVINNAALFVFVTDAPSRYFHDVTPDLKIKLFLVSAVVLFIVLGSFKYFIPDEGLASLKHLARQHVIEEVLVKLQPPYDDGFNPEDVPSNKRCCCGAFQYNNKWLCIPWLSIKPNEKRKFINNRETLPSDKLD